MLAPEEYDDVLVVVAHPFGDVEVPLTEWLRVGPGPRPLVRITRARRRSGEPVALSEIPARDQRGT
ncbi:hypothetical protein [Phytohabitans houttuyneae]|uniref:Uncharacterized protein n=1 Tax=Phytohabitans houttuyneae TaxID=1076126 RepID=A0A6V8KWT7_9ACTN|nr:hypothetical protein [Phytohabitans houttuyneae]GFJ85055.1 hypothetical protein Phou_092350 [Phytohabitans houttuyneae]